MNGTLIVLVVEVLILLGVFGLLFFLNWKRKKNKTAEFEKLLENVSVQEVERKEQLSQYLTGSYAIGSVEAQESAEYMIEAEKQFLQQFLKQQMEQTSLIGFYGNLCELLDQYLYFIPTIDTNQSEANAEKAEEPENLQNDELTGIEEEISLPGEQSDESIKEDEALEESKSTDSSENEETVLAELDWSDAFSESGDTMDDATKAGYDSETEKK